MSSSYQDAYEPILAAETFAGSPRAGNSKDVTLLVDDPTAYTDGLLPGTITLAVAFLAIALAMAAAKCCRVGIVAGKKLSDRQAAWVRPTFIVSGTLFIIAAILLVSNGLTNLQDTVAIVQQSAMDVHDISQEADSLVNTVFVDLQNIVRPIRVSLDQELQSATFCPLDPTLEGVDAARDIRNQADEARSLLQQLEDLDEVDDLTEGIQLVEEAASTIEDRANAVNIMAWHSLLVLIPFTLIPCLLVAATILVHYDVDLPIPAIIHCVLMPLFILLVIICTIGAVGFLPIVTLNADFCLAPTLATDSYPANTPDTTTLRAMDRLGYTEGPIRQVTEYYIEQCPVNATNPFGDWTTRLPELLSSQEALDEFVGTLDQVVGPLSAHCGNSFESVQGLLVDMQDLLVVLVETLERTLNTISCDRWIPLYQRAAYYGACENSLRALLYMFSCSLIMAVLGWTMIAFRSAYQPVQFK